jgi:hypothetical protein
MIVGINPCCCANVPPICCVLPPVDIMLTSYAYSAYDRPYQDATYSYVGRKTYEDLDGTPYSYCNPPLPGQVNGLDTYRYLTSATIPEGVDPAQTQRMVLLLQCDAPQREVYILGGCYLGASLWFADEDWVPTALVDDFTADAICGNMLVPVNYGAEDEFVYWAAPANTEHMDAAWQAACDIYGSIRREATLCSESEPRILQFPLDQDPSEGFVYKVITCGGTPACWTIGAESQKMAFLGADLVFDVADCEDAECA